MRAGRRATLQDIADRLGISRSTASFALTGRGRVSDATRQRVREVAAELGYRPNVTARSLRGSRTGIVALHLPPATSAMAYYTEASFGIVDEANRVGRLVTLLPASFDIATLDQLQADGVIMLDPSEDSELAREILQGSLPVVTGEPSPPRLPPADGEVTSDHAGAIGELLTHLVDRGARSPALIAPDVRSFWSYEVRASFEHWCRQLGIAHRMVVVPHPTPPAELHRVTETLITTESVDAIIAMSDGTVLNVVTSAERLGRAVGSDLLVAAAVDADVLELTRPSITALDLHPREFGTRCLQALMQVIEGPDDQVRPHEIVPISLRQRASTLGPLR